MKNAEKTVFVFTLFTGFKNMTNMIYKYSNFTLKCGLMINVLFKIYLLIFKVN